MAARIVILVSFLFLVSGCAAPFYRIRPAASAARAELKRIGLFMPRIEVFEVGPGGVQEKMDEWSKKAVENVLDALERELGSDSKLQTSRLPAAGVSVEFTRILDETELLFDAVNESILLHSYGPSPNYFEDYTFELSLGDEVSQLQKFHKADAYVLVRGADRISSAGRKALQGATVLAAAALGVIVIPQGGVATLTMALIDAHDGSVLWHAFTRSQGGTDLREPSSAAAMVKQILRSFPLP